MRVLYLAVCLPAWDQTVKQQQKTKVSEKSSISDSLVNQTFIKDDQNSEISFSHCDCSGFRVEKCNFFTEERPKRLIVLFCPHGRKLAIKDEPAVQHGRLKDGGEEEELLLLVVNGLGNRSVAQLKKIKASEMLVAPRISECFGLGLL